MDILSIQTCKYACTNIISSVNHSCTQNLCTLSHEDAAENMSTFDVIIIKTPWERGYMFIALSLLKVFSNVEFSNKIQLHTV